jgi:hypothetical protein
MTLAAGRQCTRGLPNTVLIVNGLAGMGFALPAAIAAKLVHPERNVVTVNDRLEQDSGDQRGAGRRDGGDLS